MGSSSKLCDIVAFHVIHLISNLIISGFFCITNEDSKLWVPDQMHERSRQFTWWNPPDNYLTKSSNITNSSHSADYKVWPSFQYLHSQTDQASEKSNHHEDFLFCKYLYSFSLFILKFKIANYYGSTQPQINRINSDHNEFQVVNLLGQNETHNVL